MMRSISVSVACLVAMGHVSGATAAPVVVTNNDSQTLSVATNVTTDGVNVGGGPEFGGSLTVQDGTIFPTENWHNDGAFHVGVLDFSDSSGPSETTGAVTLQSGTYLLNVGEAVIGRGFNKVGVMNVNDGAVWFNAGAVQVGAGGGSSSTHQLNIGGAVTSNESISVGAGDGTSAAVSIDGPDAYLIVNTGFGTLDIGSSGGYGEMSVLNGGRVESTYGFVGTSPGFFANSYGSGNVYVAGNDSTDEDSYWVLGDYVSVGEFTGHGTLTIDDRGNVDAQRIFIGMGGGVGNVNVNQGGKLELLNTIEIWDGSTLDVSGGGKVLAGLGFINAYDPGTVHLGLGSVLKGDGTIIGDVFVHGGTINPGHSPGKLTITGDLTLDADSVLTIEIGGTGAGEFDQFDVSGTTTLAGTLNLVFLSGFNPEAGDHIDLTVFLNIANLLGEFTGVTTEGLGPNLAAEVDLEQLANGQPLSVDITAVPEPGIGAILIAGMCVAVVRCRRA